MLLLLFRFLFSTVYTKRTTQSFLLYLQISTFPVYIYSIDSILKFSYIFTRVIKQWLNRSFINTNYQLELFPEVTSKIWGTTFDYVLIVLCSFLLPPPPSSKGRLHSYDLDSSCYDEHKLGFFMTNVTPLAI